MEPKKSRCPICRNALAVKRVRDEFHEWSGGWVIYCDSCGTEQEGSMNEDTLGGIYDARRPE